MAQETTVSLSVTRESFVGDSITVVDLETTVDVKSRHLVDGELLMSLGTDFNKAFLEGFVNKDSGRLSELITDDFRMITPLRSLSRQEALAWIGAGGSPTSLANS